MLEFWICFWSFEVHVRGDWGSRSHGSPLSLLQTSLLANAELLVSKLLDWKPFPVPICVQRVVKEVGIRQPRLWNLIWKLWQAGRDFFLIVRQRKASRRGIYIQRQHTKTRYELIVWIFLLDYGNAQFDPCRHTRKTAIQNVPWHFSTGFADLVRIAVFGPPQLDLSCQDSIRPTDVPPNQGAKVRGSNHTNRS